MKKIKVSDREFKLYIDETRIEKAVSELAEKLNEDLKMKDILFVSVLNGSFMFASDLLKKILLPSPISFVKLSSYEGTQSTGSIKNLIGLNENLEGKTVVLLEDIIDTGNTLSELFKLFNNQGVKEIIVVTLLFKPAAYNKSIPIDYVGIEIPNEFIVGYGLDYNGLGRNLPDIYQIV